MIGEVRGSKLGEAVFWVRIEAVDEERQYER